nr:hypothetical protein [Tanacetum cinerariifolium]
MDAPLSPDHAFDFFAVEHVLVLVEAPDNQNRWIKMSNLKYRHGELVKNMVKVSDDEVADSITIREIHPRVAIVEGKVHVMVSQAVQVVSRLEEIQTRVQQVESRVDTYSSGQMAVSRQDVIVGLSQPVQTLQTALHGAEL